MKHQPTFGRQYRIDTWCLLSWLNCQCCFHHLRFYLCQSRRCNYSSGNKFHSVTGYVCRSSHRWTYKVICTSADFSLNLFLRWSSTSQHKRSYPPRWNRQSYFSTAAVEWSRWFNFWEARFLAGPLLALFSANLLLSYTRSQPNSKRPCIFQGCGWSSFYWQHLECRCSSNLAFHMCCQ